MTEKTGVSFIRRWGLRRFAFSISLIVMFLIFLLLFSQFPFYTYSSLYGQAPFFVNRYQSQLHISLVKLYHQNLFFIPYFLLLVNIAFYPLYYFGVLSNQYPDSRRSRSLFFWFYSLFVAPCVSIGIIRFYSSDLLYMHAFVRSQDSIILLCLFFLFVSLTCMKKDLAVWTKYFTVVIPTISILFLFWIPIISYILLAVFCFTLSVVAYKRKGDLNAFGLFALFFGFSFDSISILYKAIPSGSLVIGLFAFYFAFLFHQFYSLFEKFLYLTRERIHSEQEILRKDHQLEILKRTAETNEKELNKLEQLILATNTLYEKALLLNEDFFPDLLEHAKMLVPEADFASFFLMQQEICTFSYTIGHNLGKLRENKEAYKYVSYLRNLPSTRLFDANVYLASINESVKTKIPSEIYLPYAEATEPAKETLVSEITGKGETYGYLSLDIAKNSEKRFSTTSFRVLGVLGSIASILLASKRDNH